MNDIVQNIINKWKLLPLDKQQQFESFVDFLYEKQVKDEEQKNNEKESSNIFKINHS